VYFCTIYFHNKININKKESECDDVSACVIDAGH